jgi:hypothetical protein
MLRLFLEENSTNFDTTFENLSPEDLKEQLRNQHAINKDKDLALNKAMEELELVRKEMDAWRFQHESAQFKVDKEKAINESLRQQLKFIQREKDIAEQKIEELAEVKKRLNLLDNVKCLIEGDKEQTDELIKNKSSVNDLKSYIIALKRLALFINIVI